ncbi:MAG: hypothetical protein LBH35_01465 [Treponema sp.]|jgi:hypothetical protein|nr:hypothetical protein [Treponema sp.]
MNVKKICAPLLFLLCASVFGQNPRETPEQTALPADPSVLVGMTLPNLIESYGAPNAVYPVRGLSSWQDDVVFVYDHAEFFVYGNRVWQLKLVSAYGVSEGDPKAQVSLVLGEGQNFDGYSVFSLPNRVWPLSLRINWDSSDRVAALYVYRSDF